MRTRDVISLLDRVISSIRRDENLESTLVQNHERIVSGNSTAIIERVNELPKEITDTEGVQTVLSHGGQVYLFRFRKGDIIPSHYHIFDQHMYIISGKYQVSSQNHVEIIEEGKNLFIPKNIRHSLCALHDGAVLVTIN